MDSTETRKSRRRNNILIIMVAAIIAAIYFFYEKQEVMVLDRSWEAADDFCNVRFTARNTKRERIWANATIKAVRKKKLVHGGYYNEVVGEKTMVIVLGPEETKSFDTSIKITAQPETVSIQTWRP